MISSRKVIIHNLLLNYYFNDSGKTDPSVVFLHGWRSSSSAWNPILSILDSKAVRFYSLDLPGFGKSEFPQKAFTLNDYVDIVIEFLQKNNLKSCLVGHSFGGRIAIKLAAHRTDLVSKLVLVDSAGFHSRTTGLKLKNFFAKLVKPFFHLPWLRPLRVKIYKYLGASDYVAEPRLKETFVNIISEDLTEHLRRILVPILILWGAKDKETPLEFGRKMNQLIPDSQFFMFEDCGHFPFINKPKEFCNRLLEFL